MTILTSLLISCGGDDNGDGPSTDDEVQTLLDEAESAMDGIGVLISFESVQVLGDTAQFADPLDLGSLEDLAAIESAVSALNDALEAGGFSLAAAAPANAFQEEDKELETIIHLNLSYLYMLAAVSRCVIDGGDVYTIEDGDVPDTPEVEVYSLVLKPLGQEGLDAVNAKEDPTNVDFLSIFEPQQRQAILNALNLMDQVEATVEAIPDGGIDGQQPDYERSICPFSSIYHHWLASLAAPLAGDREVEVTDLVGEVASEFFQSLQQQAMMWRFTIKDRPEGQ
ncbi:MAG: hypothetical protein O7E52_14050 [Candidatus Poribacteria bacterium]|nr:hypothetical protein [Candidatus Poribacteria bacterium]